jgi:hypothetical protein
MASGQMELPLLEHAPAPDYVITVTGIFVRLPVAYGQKKAGPKAR